MKIWFLSTRIAGNDGVSLEAERWRKILTKMGHKVTFVAGELDKAGILIPELHFTWPDIVELHDSVVYGKTNYLQIEERIFDVAGTIEGKLRHALNSGKRPDMIIVANVFSLPMHFPLAVALSRVISEHNIPTVARHHDFWWERKRFLKSTMFPFFKRWFPPLISQIRHVVINSASRDELKSRTGVDAEIIPDSFDFSSKINELDSYSRNFRKDFGIANDDTTFLQATRIVPRKRIELAIELMDKLNNPKFVLVIAGHAGDEGREYMDKLMKLSEESRGRVLFVGDYISANRKLIMLNSTIDQKPERRRIYTLWDAFVNCDLTTYPTFLEGFGNQFIESIYFKKPIIVTPYEVYKKDIRPLGFDVIEMPDKITQVFLAKLNKTLRNPEQMKATAEKNFEIGKKHFSYEATAKKIEKVLP
jgi:glycosyltransferase involved in cell wall biosynthesis